MGKPYKYHLRPGYGSDKLLLEFILTSTDTEFDKDLFATLKDINPRIDTVVDLWMNDEVLLSVSSDKGDFMLTKDIWDFAFIMSDNNEQCLNVINDMLVKSPFFEKEEVNFEDYRNIKT